jgi:hypothetical protein
MEYDSGFGCREDANHEIDIVQCWWCLLVMWHRMDQSHDCKCIIGVCRE